jgi:hypothetical protein
LEQPASFSTAAGGKAPSECLQRGEEIEQYVVEGFGLVEVRGMSGIPDDLDSGASLGTAQTAGGLFSPSAMSSGRF